MVFSLLYMVLRAVFRLAPAGDPRDREVEILVLRHQVQVLRRKVGRPKLRRCDRLFLAAAAHLLPKERWSCFIVTPATLLGWHRELGDGPLGTAVVDEVLVLRGRGDECCGLGVVKRTGQAVRDAVEPGDGVVREERLLSSREQEVVAQGTFQSSQSGHTQLV